MLTSRTSLTVIDESSGRIKPSIRRTSLPSRRCFEWVTGSWSFTRRRELQTFTKRAVRHCPNLRISSRVKTRTTTRLHLGLRLDATPIRYKSSIGLLCLEVVCATGQLMR